MENNPRLEACAQNIILVPRHERKHFSQYIANIIEMITLEKSREVFADRLTDYLNGRSILATSKILGVKERTLNGWIRKEAVPSLEGLLYLAQKMNVSIDYLVGLKDY